MVCDYCNEPQYNLKRLEPPYTPYRVLLNDFILTAGFVLALSEHGHSVIAARHRFRGYGFLDSFGAKAGVSPGATRFYSEIARRTNPEERREGGTFVGRCGIRRWVVSCMTSEISWVISLRRRMFFLSAQTPLGVPH